MSREKHWTIHNMEKPMEPDLLLPSAAARVAGVSPATVRVWIRAGKLPALTLSGGVRVVKRADLLRYVATRAVDAA